MTSTTSITLITALRAIMEVRHIPMFYLTQEKTPLLCISSFKSPVISIDAGVARKIPVDIFLNIPVKTIDSTAQESQPFFELMGCRYAFYIHNNGLVGP
jgi:hypothetical protein